MCFMHANAISELIDMGRQTSAIEWPAFVGYCICTAATVHIHGAHYNRRVLGGETNTFSLAAEYLSREMQQLSELRYAWVSVQHQRETFRTSTMRTRSWLMPMQQIRRATSQGSNLRISSRGTVM
jgi:hypothetical protein